MNPIINIESVYFSYENVPILKDISLKVGKGEFLGIVGPNAGGKSTLLKLILGQIQPNSGIIKIFGKGAKSASRMVGYVPQYPSFDRNFPISVEQVVLLGRVGTRRNGGFFSSLKPEKINKADYDAVYQFLEEVEAISIAKRQINSLSGGQLQRVLLARALMSEPKILLLDEPTANIDQRMESEIFDLLKKLNNRLTILVVSHDVAFISSYVNRVACINQTLICHHTDEVNHEVIQQLYGEHVHTITHNHL